MMRSVTTVLLCLLLIVLTACDMEEPSAATPGPETAVPATAVSGPAFPRLSANADSPDRACVARVLGEQSLVAANLTAFTPGSGPVDTAPWEPTAYGGGPEYVPLRALLSGPGDLIDAVLAEMRDAFDLGDEFQRDAAILQFEDGARIGRYPIPETSAIPAVTGDPTLDFIIAFNRAAASLFPEAMTLGADTQPPLAELDFVTGYPVGGSMGSSAIGADAGDGAPSGVPQQANFYSQAALTAIVGDALGRQTAAGVDLIAFDSTPIGTGAYTVSLTKTDTYTLCVHALLEDEGGPSATANWQNSHGLFAVNLARAVAPEARLTLVQVLAKDAGDAVVGSLSDLIFALYLHLEDPGATGRIRVVNLSLGLGDRPCEFPEGVVPAELRESADWPQATGAEGVLSTVEAEYAQIWSTESLDKDALCPLIAFRSVIARYVEQGVVFVAAAGNDGEKPAQRPARYSTVIGVAATANSGAPIACYTNAGDLAAPGGDGDSAQIQPNGLCQIELAATCAATVATGAPCDRGVISLALEQPLVGGSAELATMYWVGTSFAAPLISGATAVTAAACGGYAPAAIHGALRDAAAPVSDANGSTVFGGRGIVTLPALLNQITGCP